MKISLIVAMAENRIIGRNNQLPWRLPDDLKRFKRITTGHTVVMGRKTWESIGRPLPNRRNIVLTRDLAYRAPGAEVVHSPQAALELLRDEAEIFIIGGAELYQAFLERADRLYLTQIHQQFEGDAWFPEFDPGSFQETDREEIPEPIPHAFLILDRKARDSKPV